MIYRMLINVSLLFILLSSSPLSLLKSVDCYGVMSIDFGSEWMKVGLVAPSVQMDLVLNAQSERKTPMAIAVSNGERFIGDSALNVAIKFPERTYTYFLDLVGKKLEDEPVQQYQRRFPYIDISSHEPNSSSIILNHPQDLTFTPLELVAMMIEHAHDQVVARLGTNEPVSDVVITVPPYFNAVEKKVIQDAARIVGLNVLRFTNSNSAFALSYGIFRHKDYLPELNENKTSILFFDQGASHTSVTLADYHLVEQLDPITRDKLNESIPTVTIRAQVYDRFLGGLEMQLRLRDHFVQAFSKETKIDVERVYKRGRSASKVWKEAGRVKRVLSANSEYLVQIENVIDDKDLKYHMTRQMYENINEDLLNARVTKLLDKLFETPNVSRKERLESVIIVGGNTRTPKIQQVLQDYFKLEQLGKSVNADEGAVLAALYQAASLGRGFRVKRFNLEEFGEEKIRYDPAKVIVTTTTPAPVTEPPTEAPVTLEEVTASTEEGATTTPAPIPETTTTTTPKPTAVITGPPPTPDPNSIYSDAELERISKRLAKMKEDDFARLQQAALQNSLELSEIEKERGENKEEVKDEL